MKKLLITLLITIFSFSLFAQERELSDYELYRMEMEQELYEVRDTSDAPDTVYVVLEQEAEAVIVNNYYIGYNQPNYRFLLSFGSFYRPYYQPYNSYYGSWYNSYQYNRWFEYENYYGYYYPYYGYNNYWRHNNYNYGHNYSRHNGRHYGSSAGLGWNRKHYTPYNRTNRSGYIPASMAAKKSVRVRPVTTRSTTPNTKYRTYNKSRTTAPQARQQRSTTVSTPARTTRSTSYTRPSQSRSKSTYQRPAQSRSRSYSTPSRAPSKSYSTPSRSSSSYSRSSSPSRSSATRSSGGSRSSGSSSRSSGGSRSSSSKR